MFEIKNSDGKFIYPGKKMYVGVVELEITNNTYFNIDSKEYYFDIGSNTNLRITSKSDEYIRNSKRLYIETVPFDIPEEAKKLISGHLDSLRIVLLKRDFSYRTPLSAKIEEVADPRCCVGRIEIQLQRGDRLKFKETERFHNESGLWYRLYGASALPICESDVLFVESTAFEESEMATQALNALYPKFEVFLKCNSINFFKGNGTTVLINLSCKNRMSFGKSMTISRQVPFDRTLIKESSENVFLRAVLALLEYKGFHDLPNLYNILELIQLDMGENKQSKNREIIERLGLSTKDDIEKFTYSVNHVEVVGLEHARHGALYKGNPSPQKALSVKDCRSVMRNLINNWLDFKIQ